jgi:hypothetical protein
MLHEAGRFFYIAFREYWITWVTGTGVVGFLLWLINYSERVRGKQMSLRANLLILFSAFWFLGTFSAWHDADKNLAYVTSQRQQDVGNLGMCREDLKYANSTAQFFQRQADIGLSNFGSQQSTLNACIVSLGAANRPQPLRILVKEAPFSIAGSSQRSGMNNMSALVISTNKVITPVHGTLTCNRPFTLFDIEFAMGPHWTMSGSKSLIGPNKARVEIESPAWNPDVSLVAMVASAGDLSPCEFKLD